MRTGAVGGAVGGAGGGPIDLTIFTLGNTARGAGAGCAGAAGVLLAPGPAFHDPAQGVHLLVAEVGAVAFALDPQVLLEGFEHDVIAHAELFG